MTEVKEQTEVESQNGENSEERWTAQLKKILFAGIGAVALAQEEVEVLVKKLVQKGALAEQEGRKWITEVFDKRYKQTKDKVQNIEQNIEHNIEHSVENIIKKFSLPTRTQFEKLSADVEELRKKVEELCQKLQ